MAFAQAFLQHVREELKYDRDKHDSFIKLLQQFDQMNGSPVEVG